MNKDRQVQLERLDRILGVLHDQPHATREEVYSTLASRSKDSLSRRGSESERRAKDALSQLLIITAIKQSEPFDTRDTLGIDFVVTVQERENVFLQVKSSQAGIDLYISKHDLNSIRLMQRRLIILNGQIPEDRIRENFIDQLVLIHDYSRMKYRKPILTNTDRSYLLFQEF